MLSVLTGQHAKLFLEVGGKVRGAIETGEFAITVGGQAVTINATETKKWETPNIL